MPIVGGVLGSDMLGKELRKIDSGERILKNFRR